MSTPTQARSPIQPIFLALILLHGIFFLASVMGFVIFQGSLDNEFTKLAREQFFLFILTQNAKLMFGYVLISLAHFLILYPPLDRFSRRTGWRGWRIGAATAGTSMALTILVGIGVATLRPYTLAGPYARIYWSFKSVTPSPLREILFSQALYWTLIVLTLVLLVFEYTTRLRTARRGIQFGSIIGLLAALMIGTMPLLSPSAGGATPDGPNQRPNILILGGDSLRGDRLSCNGYARPTSPQIDAIAAEGVNFSRCLTPIASTMEGWLSLLTGQYPHTHGLRHMFPSRQETDQVARNNVLLPRILKRAGYDTIAVSDWAGNNFRHIDYGFETVKVRHVQNFRVFLTEAISACHPLILAYFQNSIGQKVFPELEVLSSNRSPDQVTNQVIEEIDRSSSRNRPFFMVGFYSSTHLPYSSKYPYFDLFTDPDYEGPNQTELDFRIDEFITKGFRKKLSPEEIEHIRGLYDGTVRLVDDQIKRIIKHLRDKKLLENTIVVITSDHGDDLYEPGTTLGHGISFNGGDQTSHIPLIIRFPEKIPAGQTYPQLTRAIDLAPTLLECIDLPIPPEMEGISLVPTFEPDSDSSHDLGLIFHGETSYLFFRHDIPGERMLPLDTLDKTTEIDPDFDHNLVLSDEARKLMLASKERCIRTENWKLVHTRGNGYDIYRLWNMENDPHCENNLAKDPQHHDTLERLKSWLERWKSQEGEMRIYRDGRTEWADFSTKRMTRPR